MRGAGRGSVAGVLGPGTGDGGAAIAQGGGQGRDAQPCCHQAVLGMQERSAAV